MEERIIKDINNLLTQLFQKIQEAGYEWDADKKELKKIEYKHIRELDNSYACVTFPFKAKVKSSGAIVTIHDGQLSFDGKEWIKYQSDVKDGYKVYEPNNLELVCKIEQKPWSEEDERMKNQLVSFMLSGINVSKAPYGCVAWLESLKERYTWKPSDEQMYILNWVANILLNHDGVVEEEASKKLQSLYNDLKKL